MQVTLREVHKRLNAARQLVASLEDAERELLYPSTDYSDDKTVEWGKPWHEIYARSLEEEQRRTDGER